MCGCPGRRLDDAEWERIIREIEEGETVEAPIPVTPERIPAEDWPVRKTEEVEADR
jgi:hypothetical protein